MSLYSVATKEIFKIARNISVDVAKRGGKGGVGGQNGRIGDASTLSITKLNRQEVQAFSSAAKLIDPADRGGELTKAGRALQKHGGREGSAFPAPKGNPAAINEQGQKIVGEILNNPGSIITERDNLGRFGKANDIVAPDGRGVRYSPNREFLHFLEPKK